MVTPQRLLAQTVLEFNTTTNRSPHDRLHQNVSGTAERDAAGIHQERRYMAAGRHTGGGRGPADRMVGQTAALAQHHR